MEPTRCGVLDAAERISTMFFRRRVVLRRKLLLIVPILLPLLVCSDVRIPDSLRLLTEADRLAMLYNWPKAAPLYTRAESLFAQSGDKRNALFARLGYLWVTADAGVSSENSDEVTAALQMPLVQSDARLNLRGLVAKAVLDRNTNEVAARESWEQILKLARMFGDKRWEARANAEIGQILYMDGDIKSATDMFRDALISLYLRLDLGAAIYYTAMVGNGTVEAGRPETGLQYSNFALRLASFVKDAGFPFLAHQGKARALLAMNRKAEAEGVLNEALARARIENNSFALTQLLVVAGGASHDPSKAIDFLREATEVTKQKNFQHVYAWSTWQLGRIYRDIGSLDNAELLASGAIAVMRDLEDRNHLPHHLALLADVESKKGNIDRADQLYSEATDVIEALLVNVNARQVKASLISTLSEAYIGHFELAATKFSDPEKAYEIIEQARGRSLADTLRGDSETRSSTDVEAQKKINGIQLALLHETNRSKRESLLDTLFATEQLLSPVRTTHSPLRSVPLHTLQRSLHPDEMLLEYVLAEPQSYCLRITRGGAVIIVLPAGRKRIDDLVENYLSAIRSRQSESTISNELFSILFQPVIDEGSKARLIVIPTGKLHLLPFDALRTQQGRYVLESHIVTYAPSATVLHLLRTLLPPDQLTGNLLGVGDVIYTGPTISRANINPAKTSANGRVVDDFFDVAKLPALAGTKEEVLTVAGIIRGNNQLLLGSNATEAAFKSASLASFRFIHLAVHGLADPQFPDRAALVLERGSGEDGLLQVREIRALPLRAELVILSACDTGKGKLLGEEGIASLEHAFLLAGTESVIASLWTADDWSTTFLMKRLYQHLVDGFDKGAALRQAKLDLLNDFGDQALAVYWAGFTLTGDGSTALYN